MNRTQTSSLLLEQHPKIVLRGREGLRIQTLMPAVLGDRPLTPPSLACVGFPAQDFSLYKRKGPGREGGRAVQPQLPPRGARLQALGRLLGAPRRRRGRTRVPGRGKVESSQASCSGHSGYLPRPECPGLAPRSSSALPQRPSPRCILKASQLRGAASCPGTPSRRPGGARCRSRPAARQSPRRALPRGRRRPLSTVAGLSAAAVAVCLRGGPGGLGVGKARETQPWSWKGLREAICSNSARGEAGRRHRAQLRLLPERWPRRRRSRAGAAAPPPPTDVTENRGLPSRAPPPGPASQLSERERGRRGPELRLRVSQEAGRRQISHRPTSTSWETPGGTPPCLGQGCTRSYPEPGHPSSREERGSRTYPAARVSLSYETFSLLCHRPCRPLGNAGLGV